MRTGDWTRWQRCSAFPEQGKRGLQDGQIRLQGLEPTAVGRDGFRVGRLSAELLQQLGDGRPPRSKPVRRRGVFRLGGRIAEAREPPLQPLDVPDQGGQLLGQGLQIDHLGFQCLGLALLDEQGDATPQGIRLSDESQTPSLKRAGAARGCAAPGRRVVRSGRRVVPMCSWDLGSGS